MSEHERRVAAIELRLKIGVSGIWCLDDLHYLLDQLAEMTSKGEGLCDALGHTLLGLREIAGQLIEDGSVRMARDALARFDSEQYSDPWTRIDPNDPKTWPGEGLKVGQIVWWSSEPMSGGAVLPVSWNPYHHASKHSHWKPAHIPEPPKETA